MESWDLDAESRSDVVGLEPEPLHPFLFYIFPPFAFLHSTNSGQVTVHASLWYLLSLTLLLISSVTRPDQPALWIALSIDSILFHPWAGMTSGKYVALNVFL